MSPKPPPLPGRATAPKQRSARNAPADVFGQLADSGRLRTVPLDAITPNPGQPRTHFDADQLQALADTIAKHGVLQPPVVRDMGAGTYQLVAGERRCRAARLAGLIDIEVLISTRDQDQARIDALVENVLRVDLSPIELARSYLSLVEDLGMTREAVAQKVGQNRVTISNHLRLLDLPDIVLDLIDDRSLSFAHGRALLLTDDRDTRTTLARRAVHEDWSTRRLEDEARSAGAPRARARADGVSADAAAFAGRYADALSTATGLDVRAKATATGAVTITLTDLQSARTLADQLNVPTGTLDEPS